MFLVIIILQYCIIPQLNYAETIKYFTEVSRLTILIH